MFALGGLIYHFRAPLLARVKRPVIWIAASLIGLTIIAFIRGLLVNDLDLTVLSIPIHYLSLIPAIAGVLGCLAWRVPDHLKSLDGLAGDLSYPVYLSHFMIAALVAVLWPVTGKLLFVASLPVLLLYCWILVFLLDKPITRLRDRVRYSARSSRP